VGMAAGRLRGESLAVATKTSDISGQLCAFVSRHINRDIASATQSRQSADGSVRGIAYGIDPIYLMLPDDGMVVEIPD